MQVGQLLFQLGQVLLGGGALGHGTAVQTSGFFQFCFTLAQSLRCLALGILLANEAVAVVDVGLDLRVLLEDLFARGFVGDVLRHLNRPAFGLFAAVLLAGDGLPGTA